MFQIIFDSFLVKMFAFPLILISPSDLINSTLLQFPFNLITTFEFLIINVLEFPIMLRLFLGHSQMVNLLQFPIIFKFNYLFLKSQACPFPDIFMFKLFKQQQIYQISFINYEYSNIYQLAMQEDKHQNEKSDRKLSDQLWQCQSVQFETGQLTQKQFSRVFETLKFLKLQKIQISFVLKSFYQFQKFLPFLDKQLQEFEGNNQNQQHTKVSKYNAIKTKQVQNSIKHKEIENSHQYNEYLQVQFENIDYLNIFETEFEKEIKQMETRQSCKIVTIGKVLKVYKKTKITKFLKDQIWDMKDSIVHYYENDTRFVDKIKYSAILAKRLKQKGIMFLIKRYFKNGLVFRPQSIIFYSRKVKRNEMRAAVIQDLEYDIMVIKLFNNFGNTLTDYNSINFKLLFEICIKFIDKIKYLYETEVQIDKNYGCFVVHVQHQAFSSSIREEFSNYLGKVYLFDISTENSKRVYNKLVKYTRKLPFIKTILTTRKIFICVDANRKITRDQIIEIFKYIVEDLSMNTVIGIYLGVYHELKIKERQRIISLAQTYQFYISNFNQVVANQIQMLYLRLKTFDQVEQNVINNSVMNFFVEILILQGQKSKVSLEESMMLIKNQEQSNLLDARSVINTTNILKQIETSKIKQERYKIPFSKPKIQKLDGNKVYEQDKKRDTICAKALKEIITTASFRVRMLILSEQIKFDYIYDAQSNYAIIVENIIDGQGKLLKFQSLKIKSIGQFKTSENAFIIQVDKNQNYLPNYMIERSDLSD